MHNLEISHGAKILIKDAPPAVPRLRLHASQVAWGMQCLLNALKFLHEDCKFYHNNVSTDSVFVTRCAY